MEDFKKLLKGYFDCLDETLDNLCHLHEGQISNLPNYVFKKRQIFIFKFRTLDFYLVKAVVNDNLLEDEILTGEITSNEGIWEWSNPLKFDFDFKNPPLEYGMKVVNIHMREKDNINSLAVIDIPLLSILKGNMFKKYFSIENSKKTALDEWNNSKNKLTLNYSFVNNLKNIFDSFEAIIDRKSFVERRLHRFINTHYIYLLPTCINCFFEVKLKLQDEVRKADFILQRELGLPPILIELENSFHKVFKKNNEVAIYANHAGEQIKEWVKFIESNSENTKNEFEFLRGKKERLVIVGRGLNCLEAMKDTKYGQTLIWTYDLMIYEAKKRWNKIIISQCKEIGIKNPNLLQLPVLKDY